MNLVSFETITEITNIPNADKIELAKVQGWRSVIKKGEYKVGDRVVFIPIDTVLTPADWNQFLWDKNEPTKPIRIKTAKLRGVISQGVIFPTTILKEHSQEINNDELANVLGITKYEAPIPVQLRGLVAGNFPTHILSRTDEDNLMSNVEVLNELNSCDVIEVTVKLDGTSATFIHDLHGNFKVCSRNLELKEGEDTFWNAVRKYKLREVIPKGFAIQGELCGPSIQDNPMELNEHTLCVFNIKNLNTNSYISIADVKEQHILPDTIILVDAVCYFNKNASGDLTLDQLQDLANKTCYKNNKLAEGIVIRGYHEVNKELKLGTSAILGKMLSVKVLNQHYHRN